MPGPHGFAVRSAHLRLMASTGKAPFVCTPLDRSRENPPCNCARARRCRVHRSRPTFVTMANAPLTGRDAGVLKLIWGNQEEEYFRWSGWTKPMRDLPVEAGQVIAGHATGVRLGRSVWSQTGIFVQNVSRRGWMRLEGTVRTRKSDRNAFAMAARKPSKPRILRTRVKL